MTPEPMTPIERATAVLLTQTVQLLHGADRRDVAKILHRYGIRPEEGLAACEWLLAWAAERAEGAMRDDT